MKGWILVFLTVSLETPISSETITVSADMEPYHSKQGCELTGQSTVQSAPSNLAVTYLCVEQEIEDDTDKGTKKSSL